MATAPNMIPPSAWLPVAFGDRDFGGEPTHFLLMRHYNAVVDRLAAGVPLVPAPTDDEAIRDWCAGYTLGVDLDHHWIDDPEGIEPTFPIFVLAGGTQLNAPDDEHVIEDEEGWLREAKENLDGVVMDTYEALSPARRALASAGAVQRPIRRGPKIGRNEPCPCGSGKKYKKCCLRAAT